MSRGHIRQRGAHSWQIVASAGNDPLTGQRRQVFRTIRGGRQDAEQELTKVLGEIDRGRVTFDAGRTTVKSFLDRWLQMKKSRVRPKTFERYESIIRTHINPALGGVRLTKLRAEQLQAFEDALPSGRIRGKGQLSDRTALHIHRVFTNALNQAVKWQLIDTNPMKGVEPPRPARPHLPVVGPEQAGMILRAARGCRLELLIVLALASGARLGELLGLRWVDVDLDQDRIHIRHTLQNGPEGLTLVEPKSESGRRVVSLPRWGIAALRSQKSSQTKRRLLLGEAWSDEGFVIDAGDGRPLKPENVSRAFGKWMDNSGLPKIRFHDLRHAHATLMLAQGVHPKVVSERLGHSGIAITLDTYSDVIPALQQQAAEVLDALFPEAGA